MTVTTLAGIAILAVVTLQRLTELVLANANSRRLLANGGAEHGRGHYPFIVAVHALWLASLWWLGPGRPINALLLGAFALLQLGRLWVINTLGERWTTRIIVLPGERLVRAGPYRYLSHPNYMIVTLEFAILPLVFGLWRIALLFSLLYSTILWVRIGAENRALASLRG